MMSCPTCGHRVHVVGRTTQSYEATGCVSVDSFRDLLRQLPPGDISKDARKEIEKLLNQPGRKI